MWFYRHTVSQPQLSFRVSPLLYDCFEEFASDNGLLVPEMARMYATENVAYLEAMDWGGIIRVQAANIQALGALAKGTKKATIRAFLHNDLFDRYIAMAARTDLSMSYLGKAAVLHGFVEEAHEQDFSLQSGE